MHGGVHGGILTDEYRFFVILNALSLNGLICFARLVSSILIYTVTRPMNVTTLHTGWRKDRRGYEISSLINLAKVDSQHVSIHPGVVSFACRVLTVACVDEIRLVSDFSAKVFTFTQIIVIKDDLVFLIPHWRDSYGNESRGVLSRGQRSLSFIFASTGLFAFYMDRVVEE